MRTRGRVRVALIAVGALIIGMVGQMALSAGGGIPANKATASGSTTKEFAPAVAVELLQSTIHTSKPTDLLIQTSLECSILTKLQTGPNASHSGNAAISTAKAHAHIRGWIEVDDDPNSDGPEVGAAPRVVPVVSSSAPPQNGSTPNTGDKEVDSATYCDRTYERTVEDGEDPKDGIDRQTDYIDTKTANAFNWVLLNTGSGVWYVRLMGDLVGVPTPDGTCTRDTVASIGDKGACTEAYVGNRTMIIEPTKMANDANVG